MFAVTVVSPKGYAHSEAFREVAETLHFGLLSIGVDSVLTADLDVPGRTHLVLGANLLPRAGAEPRPGSILYNLEQIDAGSPWLTPAYLALLKRHRVWDYSQRNVERLRALGVQGVEHVPLGYVPQLTRLEPRAEDIDVAFFGSVNARRLEVLEALARRGLSVHAAFGAYGQARDAVLARARIALNLHYYEAKVFEIVRVSYLLANRRFVVSERGADLAEESALEGGVVFGRYDELVELCARYAALAAERERIAARGFELFSARPEGPLLARALSASPPRPGLARAG